ncbi:hypothetical protein B296_00005099 [Ensete ventricosum]|uniref:Uncharacterized protein n=1 Tax=Ensete ventricosum TaxID=4639 RepID=A0A426ZKF0_ENSVE|nr:hypothetical protein B296_00005099 [Ensete ventricosum]
MARPPSGTALAHKGGACGHSAGRSCRSRGYDTRPANGQWCLPQRGSLVGKATASGDGHWMRAEGES